MTSHKTISSLSVAATVVFFAAIPCFAQSRQDDAGAATSAQAAINIMQPTVALNRDRMPRRAIASTAADEKVARANQPGLSAAMFEQSADQFSAGASQRLMTSAQSDFGPRADISKQHFSNDSASCPRITFVPSRGQRLPQN
jgi:hypothetical protein